MRGSSVLGFALLSLTGAAHAIDCNPDTNPQSTTFVVARTPNVAAAPRAQMAAALRRQLGPLAVRLDMDRALATGHDVIELRGSPQAVAAAVERLARAPGVKTIEPEVAMTLHWSPSPVDSQYASQWGLKVANGISAENAWNTTRGTGTTVAILDTGYTTHTDMPELRAGYDFVSSAALARDGDGRDAVPLDNGDYRLPASLCDRGRDSTWHGTHVAGIAGAIAANGKGIAGVANLASVQHVRVVGDGHANSTDIADAIMWAAGASVPNVPAVNSPRATSINISVGQGGTCPSYLQQALDYAASVGSVVVVSAGNDGIDASGQALSNCRNTISVGAHTSAGLRASFSNHGPAVDLYAPGEGIISTYNASKTTPGNETYAYANGTSQAAPHVAGTVALMQAAAPSAPIPVNGVLEMLKRTAIAMSDPNCVGCKRLDAAGAVVAAAQWPRAMFVSAIKRNFNGCPIQYSGNSTSTDPQGTTGLAYRWTRNGAVFSTGTSAAIALYPGVNTIVLRVTDPQGHWTEQSLVVDASCSSTQ